MSLNFDRVSAEPNTVVKLSVWTTLRKSSCVLTRVSALPPAAARIIRSGDLGRKFRHALAAATLVAGVLLFASTTADATVDSRPALAAALSRPQKDPRIARLEKFFHLYRCPAPLYVTDYLRVADQNDLDYRLLPAISIRETQCGVTEQNNNRLGFHPDVAKFPTVLTGIEFIARRLAENPLYKGKSLEQKLFTYNPFPAYPGEIQWIMRQIEP